VAGSKAFRFGWDFVDRFGLLSGFLHARSLLGLYCDWFVGDSGTFRTFERGTLLELHVAPGRPLSTL